MTTRRRFLWLAGSGVLVVAAAGSGILLLPGNGKSSGPPRIKLGQEPCAHCGMIISSLQFAGGWRAPSGEEAHFDDIGCFRLAWEKAHLPAGSELWVHTYDGDLWLEAHSAQYLVNTSVKTPMSYAVIAVTPESASALQSRFGGDVVDWEAVAANLPRRG